MIIPMKQVTFLQTSSKLGFAILMWVICLTLPTFAIQDGDDGEENDAITLAPRALRRQIATAEEAIQNKRYAEAVETLGKILMEDVDELEIQAQEFSQDYFLERRSAGVVTGSIRSRAAELIESLPPENREAIELRYGVTAKQKLDEAIGRFDWNDIETISRKYFHTSAGYEASMLLAQRYRTDGQPMSAALMCERLLESPGAQRKFGAKLYVYAAECWSEAGRLDNAMRVMLAANQKFPGTQVDWNGKAFTLGADKVWTENDLKVFARSSVSGSISRDWWMAGGNATRNGESAVALPMPSPSWQTPLTRGRPDEVRLQTYLERRNPSAPTLISGAGAAIVGNTVVYKTIDHSLRGVDLQTGKIQWEQSLISSSWEDSTGMGQFADEFQSPGIEQIANRVWSSLPYWQLSTDGEKVFLVSKPTEAQDQNGLGGRFRQPFFNLNILRRNYLEAFSIEGQGKAIWRIGGEDGADEPALAGAYFLGAPLWMEGSLYVVANLNGETTFLSLDPETGLVQWMQQLAQSPKQGFGDLESDDASNIHLAFSDGIVICPTGSGVVVAIDVAARSLRWAYRYRDTTQITVARGGPFNSPIRREIDALNERRWGGLPVMIADSRVIVASAESDQLFCLDLISGDVQWTQRRDPYRYVGGVFDGKVFLVGDKSVAALNLTDGRLAWPSPMVLPSNKLVAGIGARRGGSYFLPLQSQEILEINLANGELLGTAKSEVPLGNLIAFREQVLSISPMGMSLFRTQKDLKQAVTQKLAKDANDAWALARSSELLNLESKDGEALDVLQRAIKLHPQNDEIRFLLVKSILTALESDFEKYQPLATEVEPLLELRPQRIAFLIAMTKGYLKSQTPEKAIEPIMSIIDIRSREPANRAIDPYRMLQPELGHDVDSDSWISAQVSNLYRKLEGEKRESFIQRIVLYFEQTKDDDLLTQTNRLDYFQGIDALAPRALEIAYQWIDRGAGKGWLLAESILTPYAFSVTSTTAVRAQELLLKLYETSGNRSAKQNLQAALAMRVSNADFNLTATLSELNFELAKSIVWPTTKTKTELKSAENGMFRPTTQPSKMTQSLSIPLAGFEVRDSSDRVVLVNPEGREALVVNCDASDGRPGTEVRTIRSLLVVQRRTDIMVIDTLGNYSDSRDAVLWKLERFSPETLAMGGSISTQTRANTLGLEIVRNSTSSDSVARLGPVFEHSVIVVRGGTLQALNLLNGNVLWSKTGFGANCEFLQTEDRLIVLDGSNRKHQVLDARDGTILDATDFEPSNTLIKNWNEFALDFRMEASDSSVDTIAGNAKKQVILRLWNTLTGESVMEKTVSSEAKAAFGLGRYFAILEPNGAFAYWDMATKTEKSYELLPIEKLKHIYLMPVYDRFLLLTESSKDDEVQDVKVAPEVTTSRTLFVNGYVYAIDYRDGEPIWPQPAKMYLLNASRVQSRYSPIIAFYRNLEWFNSKSQSISRSTVALMDVRNGSLVFQSNLLGFGRTDSTTTESYPEQEMVYAKHGNELLQVTWTDEAADATEVANYGKVSVSSLVEEGKGEPESLRDRGTPFNIFDDIDPPNP